MPVAEEIPFELLHLELVGQILEKTDAEERERALANLELIGFNAGYRLIEKLTKESPKFKDELDLMKFICKDFWMSVFRKQIDNLRTNHQVRLKQGNMINRTANSFFCSRASTFSRTTTSSSSLRYPSRSSTWRAPQSSSSSAAASCAGPSPTSA